MAHAIHTKGTALSFPARLGEMLTQARDALQARRVFRRTFDELNNLSVRELDDLGLTRGQIRSIALESAYGPAK